MTFVSYAQNFEDVILWRALKHIEKGFYIDIGAQDPVSHSVSLGFYERGWRGVHVEPIPTYAKAIKQARPDELIVQAAIGSIKGKIGFYDIADTGLSTGEKLIAEQHKAAGFKVRKTKVDCVPLCEILNACVEKEIHWLKIDVEGMEQQVIESWHPSPVRPWIIVVESTKPLSPEPDFEAWEPQLIKLGYDFVYFDGLNRFYVSRKHKELKASFGPGPNYFDYYVLSGTIQAAKDISKLKKDLSVSSTQLNGLIGKRDQAENRARMSEVRTAIIKDNLAKNKSSVFQEFTRPLSPITNYLGVLLATKGKGVQESASIQSFNLHKRVKKIKLPFANPTLSSTLAIEIPQPVSPRQLGKGEDDRRLGLGLHKLEIVSKLSSDQSRIVRFDKPVSKDIIKDVVGLSNSEEWGTWSLGDVVILNFCNPLPESFELLLEASAFGPNVGRTFIAHLFISNSDELEAGDRNPTMLTRHLWQSGTFSRIWSSASSVFPQRWINSWNSSWGLRKDNKSNVEFMIDPQPEAKAAWQTLIDNSNSQSKSQK